MPRVYLLLFLVIAVVITCVSFVRHERRPLSVGAQAYGLTPKELKSLQNRGGTNAAAAVRLYLYYSFGRYDQSQSTFWEKRAAALGNPGAQYNLAKQIKEEGGSVEEFRQWMSLAASQGFQEAGEALVADELRKSGQTPRVTFTNRPWWKKPE